MKGERGAMVTTLLLATALAGCGGGPVVERAYDGDVIAGRYVGPEAYAAYLRGALAEADGHLDEALQAYEDAASRQPGSPEVWTRIGAVRCRRAPHDPGASAALDRAASLDAHYAPAWAARAACALSGGALTDAQTFAQRAASLDAGADAANVLLARTASRHIEPATRVRLVALTATARDPVVAWDALSTWASEAGDVSLWARALRELARRAPTRRVTIARAAEALAGSGALGDARSVAAAAVDASDEPLPGGHPLAARLAIDEAIGRGDGAGVRARATRVRLGLDEAAARALLAGQPHLARELAEEVTQADPAARGARLVLAASTGGDPLAMADVALPSTEPMPAAALVALGEALSRAGSRAGARAMLDTIRRDATEPIVDGDDLVARPAVELAFQSLLDPAALPPNAAVELAALRGVAVGSLAGLDPRHELLALSLQRSDAPRARELARRLTLDAPADPVVVAAAALAQLGSDADVPPDLARAILARNPSDPLLAAVALRLAEHTGEHAVAAHARSVLAALGSPAVPGPPGTE